uniref:Uncharacterized protein n=1 Tax=Ciona savignyi TaxID=51511 RepID=H2Y9Z3_CIOSA
VDVAVVVTAAVDPDRPRTPVRHPADPGNPEEVEVVPLISQPLRTVHVTDDVTPALRQRRHLGATLIARVVITALLTPDGEAVPVVRAVHREGVLAADRGATILTVLALPADTLDCSVYK